MSVTEKVTLTLPRQTLSRLDEVATAERRSRSNAAAVLLDRAIAAGLQRLDELERLARAGASSQRPEAGATEAGQAHLREHAKLCGLDAASPSEETDHRG